MQFTIPSQRLDARLTSLDGALATLSAHCRPVPERLTDLDAATGFYLSRDVIAPCSSPPVDTAASDGFAACSMDLIGASSFSPAFVTAAPVFVSIGDAMPNGCDCVVDLTCVDLDGPPFAISASPSPGEGVRRVAADVCVGSNLFPAGLRLSLLHSHILHMAGVPRVYVRRPCVHIVGVPSVAGSHSFELVSELASASGIVLESSCSASRSDRHIIDAISALSQRSTPDLLLVVGGSGMGAGDHAIIALRLVGAQLSHGLALSKCATIGFGSLNGAAFVAIPGSFDSALCGWLGLVAPMLNMLCGAPGPASLESARLTRKISSAPGVSDIVLLERVAEGWAPSPAEDMSFAQALRAHGYLIIDAGGEGLAEGACVRPLALPGCWRG